MSTKADGLPSLLMQAAHSAAVADGLIPNASAAAVVVERNDGPTIKVADPEQRSVIQVEEISPKVKVEEEIQSAVTVAVTVAPPDIKPPDTTTTTTQVTPIPNNVPPMSPPKPVVKQEVTNDGVSALADAAAKSSPVLSSSTTPVAAPPPVTTSQQTPSSSNSNTSSSNTKKSKGQPLRRGKWTAEEEAYANRLIQEFKSGLLPLTDGTTLRTFLSKLLNCDPMRISKKFVGSNCIGKQVFRRRTAEINRLTLEQIQLSRAELSELERRFLDRVAQTNRVKTSGQVTNQPSQEKEIPMLLQKSPPWLCPPNGYKPAAAAAISAATSALTRVGVSNSINNRAAAAGRALLANSSNIHSDKEKSKQPLLTTSSANHGSAGLLALAELHRRRSQEKMLHAAAANAAKNSNLLNASFQAAQRPNLSNAAMAQIARNSSAAKIASLAVSNNNSFNNLMLKHGLSREHLSQLAQQQQLASRHSLQDLVDKKSSFDALMSLEFQSLQSIDNLANLIQSGSGLSTTPNVPKSGLKNWSMQEPSNQSLKGLQHLRSQERMESLMRSLSGNLAQKNTQSNANWLQSQLSLNSAASLLSNNSQAMSLANLLRNESSTGLTALRMQDGLSQRNSSVDDFLSLVASGDIPHQDPHLLNLPLQTMLQQQQQSLVQQQLLAQQKSAQQLLAQQKAASLLNLAKSPQDHSQSLSLLQNLAAKPQDSQQSNQIQNLSASLLNYSKDACKQLTPEAVAFAQQQQARAQAQMNMSANALAAARLAASNGSLKRKFTGGPTLQNNNNKKR